MAKDIRNDKELKLVDGFDIHLFEDMTGDSFIAETPEQAKEKIREWKSKGVKRANIIVVNYNPNLLFKDIFVSVGSSVPSYGLSVRDSRLTRSYKGFQVKFEDGTKSEFFLEMRMSVLRTIVNISESVRKEVERLTGKVVDELIFTDDMVAKFNTK